MDPDVSFVLDSTEEGMKNSLEHLERELVKIRAGKANPIMLTSVRVQAYGSSMPINQVASIVASDPRTITVTPFDKGTLHNIERGIVEANLGFNPQNDGTLIRVPIPPLNEERRKELVKQAKNEGENAKISIRNIRRDANSDLKELKNGGISEDMVKRGEDRVNELTTDFSNKVDEMIKKKEEEILTI